MSSAENGKPAGRLKARIKRNSVAMPNGCREWRAWVRPEGYGTIKVAGRTQAAHRVAYELWRGPIPSGMHLDHIACDNRRCVNPWHMLPVTPRENTLRSEVALCAINARKTHCIHGHEFTPENTSRNGNGRSCRACARESSRRYAARKRQEAA